MKVNLSWYIALIPFLVHGCAVSHTDITFYRNEGFIYEHLRDGGIVMGGVVSVVKSVDEEISVRYAGMLGERLAGRYPGIEIYPPGKVLDDLGEDYYHEVADEYRVSGDLSPRVLERLNDLVVGRRYLIMARVIENAVTYDRDQYTEETGYDHELIKWQEDKPVDSPEVTVWTELSTTRKMAVEIDGFDLPERERIVSVMIRDEETRFLKHGRVEKKGHREKPVNEVVQAAAGMISDIVMQPSPPDEGKLLDRIFGKFADNFHELVIGRDEEAP